MGETEETEAAEPAKEFLYAMAGQCQTDPQAEDEERNIHGDSHLSLSFLRLLSLQNHILYVVNLLYISKTSIETKICQGKWNALRGCVSWLVEPFYCNPIHWLFQSTPPQRARTPAQNN